MNSTSEYETFWLAHCAQVEADAGKTRVIAALVSDGAKYMDTLNMRTFHLNSGIVHYTSPPYTPELNSLAERTIRSVFEMARSMVIH